MFFFQAEDGIRDLYVTGVQTCALPISDRGPWSRAFRGLTHFLIFHTETDMSAGQRLLAPSWSCGPMARSSSMAASRRSLGQIGRASCRERVESTVVAVALKVTIATTQT